MPQADLGMPAELALHPAEHDHHHAGEPEQRGADRARG